MQHKVSKADSKDNLRLAGTDTPGEETGDDYTSNAYEDATHKVTNQV